jgi:hypothetical protein
VVRKDVAMRATGLTVEAAILIALAAGCDATGPDATGPSGGTVEIRTLHNTYRPLDLVIVHVTNRLQEPIFNDLCGGEIEGRGFPELGWNGSYGTGRVCMFDPEPQPIRIDPGETIRDSLHVNHVSYVGEWRFNLLLRDAQGAVLPEHLRVSNTFLVLGYWHPRLRPQVICRRAAWTQLLRWCGSECLAVCRAYHQCRATSGCTWHSELPPWW